MLDLFYAKKPLVKTANSRKMTTFRKVLKWPLLKSLISIPLILTYNVCIFLDTGNSTGNSTIDLTEVWQVRMREVIYSC